MSGSNSVDMFNCNAYIDLQGETKKLRVRLTPCESEVPRFSVVLDDISDIVFGELLSALGEGATLNFQNGRVLDLELSVWLEFEETKGGES